MARGLPGMAAGSARVTISRVTPRPYEKRRRHHPAVQTRGSWPKARYRTSETLYRFRTKSNSTLENRHNQGCGKQVFRGRFLGIFLRREMNGGWMYELFLLGKLIERPWHGYEFHQVLNSVVGPARQVSWGTIYPLLQRLEKAGLIPRLSDPSDQDDGRGRQRYTITQKRKQRFLSS